MMPISNSSIQSQGNIVQPYNPHHGLTDLVLVCFSLCMLWCCLSWRGGFKKRRRKRKRGILAQSDPHFSANCSELFFFFYFYFHELFEFFLFIRIPSLNFRFVFVGPLHCLCVGLIICSWDRYLLIKIYMYFRTNIYTII
jgi:hypothetical protein